MDDSRDGSFEYDDSAGLLSAELDAIVAPPSPPRRSSREALAPATLALSPAGEPEGPAASQDEFDSSFFRTPPRRSVRSPLRRAPSISRDGRWVLLLLAFILVEALLIALVGGSRGAASSWSRQVHGGNWANLLMLCALLSGLCGAGAASLLLGGLPPGTLTRMAWAVMAAKVGSAALLCALHRFDALSIAFAAWLVSSATVDESRRRRLRDGIAFAAALGEALWSALGRDAATVGVLAALSAAQTLGLMGWGALLSRRLSANGDANAANFVYLLHLLLLYAFVQLLQALSRGVAAASVVRWLHDGGTRPVGERWHQSSALLTLRTLLGANFGSVVASAALSPLREALWRPLHALLAPCGRGGRLRALLDASSPLAITLVAAHGLAFGTAARKIAAEHSAVHSAVQAGQLTRHLAAMAAWLGGLAFLDAFYALTMGAVRAEDAFAVASALVVAANMAMAVAPAQAAVDALAVHFAADPASVATAMPTLYPRFRRLSAHLEGEEADDRLWYDDEEDGA